MAASEVLRENYGRRGPTDAIVRMAQEDAHGEPLTIAHLGAYDELHMGGTMATLHVLDALRVTSSDHVLDVGCGLGGPARVVASTTGAHVTGVDLVPELLDTAVALTALVGLDDLVGFHLSDGVDLPLSSDTATVALVLHVGMNVSDKAALFGEIHRVLVPEGRVAVYDQMRTSERQPEFPVPWAGTPDTSYVETAADYRAHLVAARFEVTHEEDMTQLVLEVLANAAASGRATGQRRLMEEMNPDGGERLTHLVQALSLRVLAPVLMVAQAR